MTKGGPMEGDEEELTELGLAHDTGRLCWGMWVCDCARCRALCRQSPDVLLVIKGSDERRIVTAGIVADRGADELPEEGYVREVFVAQEQPPRRGSGAHPPAHAPPGPGRPGGLRAIPRSLY